MKLSEAIKKGTEKYWDSVHVRKNPKANQWFVMLCNRESKQFMLVDEAEVPIVDSDLNNLAELLARIGIKDFTVFL